MHLTKTPDLPKTSIEWNREEYSGGMECSFRHLSRVLFRYFTINIIHQTTHIHIHTAQWPWVPSKSQSLKPSTVNGDVSKWVKHSRVGRNIQKQTNKQKHHMYFFNVWVRKKYYWFPRQLLEELAWLSGNLSLIDVKLKNVYLQNDEFMKIKTSLSPKMHQY